MESGEEVERIKTEISSSRLHAKEQDDEEQRRIQESIRKLQMAAKQQALIKVVLPEGQSKVLTVEDEVCAQDLCYSLITLFGKDPGPNWAIVEVLPSLEIQRVIEDHENVTIVCWHWPRCSNDNYFLFKTYPEKYYITSKPELLLPEHPKKLKGSQLARELFVKEMLLEVVDEANVRKGKAFMWKRKYLVGRRSGLFYRKQKKPVTEEEVLSWKDIECYTGNEYMKVYGSATPYCFSLVPNSGPLKDIVSTILHVCVASSQSLRTWVAYIRLVKHGSQLYMNYHKVMSERELPTPTCIGVKPVEDDYKDSLDKPSTKIHRISDPLEAGSHQLASPIPPTFSCGADVQLGRKNKRLKTAFAEAWKNAESMLKDKGEEDNMQLTRKQQLFVDKMFTKSSGMFTLRVKKGQLPIDFS